MKYKTYFKVTLTSLDAAKFNNNSEQFECGAHTARYIGCEIV